MNLFLDLFAVIAILGNVVVSIKSIEKGLLIALLVKPLIDMGWDFNIGPFSLIDVHTIFFLLIGYLFIIRRSLFKVMNRFILITWLIAHFGLLFGFIQFPGNSFDGLARMLFLPLGLVILPYFWFNSKTRKKLINYLLLGSLLPSLIILFQVAGFLPTETVRMTKGFVRMNGFYHDIVTSRMYILQGLLVLFVVYKLNVFKIRFSIKLIILMILLVAGFFLYSKAFVGIVLLGFGFFIITQRSKFSIIIIPLLILPVFIMFSDTVLPTVEQMFVSEIEYNQGELSDSSRLFSGRGSIWNEYLNDFNQSSFLTQLIGFNKNDGRTHNEFLRITILSGLIGLLAYLFFFLTLIRKVVSTYIHKRELMFISVWLISIMLLDSISVVWGLYPQYLLVFMGFMIISFKHPKTDNNSHLRQ